VNGVSEREDVSGWRDPADPSEKRDWDLPPRLHRDPRGGEEFDEEAEIEALEHLAAEAERTAAMYRQRIHNIRAHIIETED
jgi:hypothetical protein